MNVQMLTVGYSTRTGWMRFIITVANHLAHWHLRPLAALWLFSLQRTFIIGIHIKGQNHHLGPFRWRRWSYRRTHISVNLRLTRREPIEETV